MESFQSIEENKEESFQLSNTQEYECALKAMLLLRSALEVQGQSTDPPPPRPTPKPAQVQDTYPSPPRPTSKPAQAQLPIDPSDAGIREPLWEVATSVPNSRQEIAEPSNNGNWEPLTSLVIKTRKPPANTNIKLPDSSTKPLKHWTDLFAFVAEYLVKTGKISVRNCPVSKGKSKRYLLHTEPIHPNGKEFLFKREIGDGLWLFTQFDRDKTHENACWLLENFGVDPSTVLVSTNRS